MDNSGTTRAGQCHCGAVRFEARLSDGFDSLRRCTCSYCRMRGAVIVSAEMDGIDILQGADVLTLYRFNTGVAQHFFCSRCGIYTHHRRRSNADQYGVNVACLDGVSPFDFAAVPVAIRETGRMAAEDVQAALRGNRRTALQRRMQQREVMVA